MKFSTAITLALFFHLALFFAIDWMLTHGQTNREIAKLDLTSVELSFAKNESDENVRESEATENSRENREVPIPRETNFRENFRENFESEKFAMTETEVVVSPPIFFAKNEHAFPAPENAPPPKMANDAASSASAEMIQRAKQQARVKAQPKAVTTIRPIYPESSRRRGEAGDVTVRFRVAVSGRATNLKIVRSSGFPALDHAAQNAVASAQFTPAQEDGASVAAEAELTLSFKLTKKSRE